MLNLKVTHCAALMSKPLNVSQHCQQISTAYQTEAVRLADSPLWGSKVVALTAYLASTTGCMRVKLYQTCQNMSAIPTNFYQTCWFKDTTSDPHHRVITLIQATVEDNQPLLTMLYPLSPSATQ